MLGAQRRSQRHDRGSSGAGCAVELREADARRTWDLAVAGLATQLAYKLVNLAKTRRADRLAVGDQPAVGVDRHGSVDLCGAVGQQLLLLTVCAEATLGHVD